MPANTENWHPPTGIPTYNNPILDKAIPASKATMSPASMAIPYPPTRLQCLPTSMAIHTRQQSYKASRQHGHNLPARESTQGMYPPGNPPRRSTTQEINLPGNLPARDSTHGISPPGNPPRRSTTQGINLSGNLSARKSTQEIYPPGNPPRRSTTQGINLPGNLPAKESRQGVYPPAVEPNPLTINPAKNTEEIKSRRNVKNNPLCQKVSS